MVWPSVVKLANSDKTFSATAVWPSLNLQGCLLVSSGEPSHREMR
jgi:hypothetical protein